MPNFGQIVQVEHAMLGLNLQMRFSHCRYIGTRYMNIYEINWQEDLLLLPN